MLDKPRSKTFIRERQIPLRPGATLRFSPGGYHPKPTPSNEREKNRAFVDYGSFGFSGVDLVRRLGGSYDFDLAGLYHRHAPPPNIPALEADLEEPDAIGPRSKASNPTL
jgi:hypothetical protein